MPTWPKKRECPVCHEMVASGKGFGGHMSKHSTKRRKNGSKAAQKAANAPRTPKRRLGRRIAPSTVSRVSAGGDLPRPPAHPGFPSSHVSGLVRNIREVIAKKLAQAQELQKMAVRLEQLL